MPRQSQAAASILAPRKPRLPSTTLPPPRGMTKRAAAIFRELTDSVEPDHFETSDIPLLRQFCSACELAERAEVALSKHGAVTDKGRPSAWLPVLEKATRITTALSLRLRISPQARATNKRRAPFGRLV